MTKDSEAEIHNTGSKRIARFFKKFPAGEACALAAMTKPEMTKNIWTPIQPIHATGSSQLNGALLSSTGQAGVSPPKA